MLSVDNANIAVTFKFIILVVFIGICLSYTAVNPPQGEDIRCDGQLISYFPTPMKQSDAAKFCAGLGGELVSPDIVEDTECLKQFVDGNPTAGEIHKFLHTASDRLLEGQLCPKDEHFFWDIFGLVDVYRKTFFDYCNLPLPFACQFTAKTYAEAPPLSVGIPPADDDTDSK